MELVKCAWSESGQKCLVADTELKLYEWSVCGLKSKHLGSTANMCDISWNPNLSFSNMISCGYSSGRVILANLSKNEDQLDIQCELTPSTNQRMCQSVSFNNNGDSLMIAFERARNQNSINIFDIESLISGGLHDLKPIKPHLQFAMNEQIHSQAWISTTRFVAESAPFLSIQSKAVFCIAADPYYPSQFASCGEDGIIKLWDLRYPSKNILSINSESKSALEIMEWSPSKPGLLATVGKDATAVKFWDINRISNDDKGEVRQLSSVLQGLEAPPAENVNSLDVKNVENTAPIAILKHFRSSKLSDETINGFSWLPKTISNGMDLKFFSFTKNCCMISSITAIPVFSISPKEEFAFCTQNSVHVGSAKSLTSVDYSSFIAANMISRANAGYSLNAAQNMEILGGEDPRNEELISLWSLINGPMKLHKFEGLLSILENMSLETEKVKTVDPGTGFFLTTYNNPSRTQSLSFCLKEYNLFDVEEESPEKTISELLQLRQFEKAAGIAFLYQGDISKSVEYLQQSEDENLLLVATAFTAAIGKSHQGQRKKVWKTLCESVSTKLKSMHLRIIFGLMANEGDWISVLEAEDINVWQGMSIALRFLDNEELLMYAKGWAEKLTLHGRLDGLLLTGLTSQGYELIQKYIDHTGDVQTGSLLSIIQPLKAGNPRNWIESYKNMLDRWKMFHARAAIDISMADQRKSTDRVPQQVYLRCNYCSQPLTLSVNKNKSDPKSQMPSKLNACPHCKKPLPKCALCLQPLGTLIKGQSKFDSSFTWCQTCRHGGHAIHMLEWFYSHNTCPVSGCSCRCHG